MAPPPTDDWFARRTHRWQDWTLAELLDAERATGTRVDLGRRAHRNQSLRDLGAMATQTIAAAERRSGRTVPDSVLLRQYQPGAASAERREVPVGERPPAAPHLAGGPR